MRVLQPDWKDSAGKVESGEISGLEKQNIANQEPGVLATKRVANNGLVVDFLSGRKQVFD